MSESGGFCRWCVGFLFTLGLTAFFLWLSYRPIHPRYFIIAFQVSPAGDRTPTAASGGNATVDFTLEIENKNKHMGVLHDAINVSLSYGNRSGQVVTIPAFYQGHDKTADKAETAGAGWLPRGAASPGTAVLRVRVGVETGYRYQVPLWKSRHHWVKVGADVEVDGEGKKAAKKGIRLRASSAQLSRSRRLALAVSIAVVVMVMVDW